MPGARDDDELGSLHLGRCPFGYGFGEHVTLGAANQERRRLHAAEERPGIAVPIIADAQAAVRLPEAPVELPGPFA